MKKHFFVCFSLLALYCNTVAQSPALMPASRSIANTSVSDTRQWSSFSNPAMLGYKTAYELGIQYENKYMIHELSTKSVQFTAPTHLLNTGVSFSYFGYSLYHHMMLGVGFSRNFSNKFSLGLQMNHASIYSIASHCSYGAFVPQLGISVKMSELLSIGFHSFNPFQSNIKGENLEMKLPSVFSLGSEYAFSPSLYWRTQVDKELSSIYRLATGLDYDIPYAMQLKVGLYGTDYLVPCLGVSLTAIKHLIVSINTELHPLLGLNTMGAVSYRFGDN